MSDKLTEPAEPPKPTEPPYLPNSATATAEPPITGEFISAGTLTTYEWLYVVTHLYQQTEGLNSDLF